MDKRPLGTSSLAITPIGFGTWAIAGANWEYSWGTQDDRESIATIERALDRGINWIDTAAVYGLGHAEQIVGRAIGKRPPSQRPYVFTKCSLVWDDAGRITHSMAPRSIRSEIEASLRRLGVETIDLYQVHWPAYPLGAPVGDIEAAMTALAELQKAGKIREIGVSNFDVAQLKRASAVARIASLQPPYSMLMRDVEKEIFPYCREQNIGVIVYSPLQSGLLSGSITRERIAALPRDDWRATRSPDLQEPRLTRNLELVDLLREIGARHGKSPAEVAIAWTLRHPAVTGAIVGARRADQIDRSAGAAEFRLGEAEIAQIAMKLPESSGTNLPQRNA
jgi:aryl-alcohol dehydrogenase-like predicted oxidoreductase